MPSSVENDNSPQQSGGQSPDKLVCKLSTHLQKRNLIIFGINKSMVYLAAPAVYVGNLDAVILNKLGYCDKMANLPAAAYLWSTAPFLVVFAWFFCQVRMLKPILVASYVAIAVGGLIAAGGLIDPQSNCLITALIMRATLLGWCGGVAGLFEWEILARGVAEKRRGLALSLAFGLGPILAVIGSLGSQMVLSGRLGPWVIGKMAFPLDFIGIFLASTIIMGVPVVLSMFYVVPLPEVEIRRQPFVAGIFGGLGDFLGNRLLMLTTVALLLMILGSDTILPNVVLYTKEAMGESPQQYAGYQFALRFGFKAVVGLLLGWMLTRTYPRAGLAATTGLCLAGLVWALAVPGKWYLLSFGILGAGELYYVYYQNYIISCSPASRVRPNLAYASLLALPATFAPVAFGMISDAYGLKSSIEVAIVILVVALLLVQLALPRWPNASFNKTHKT